MEEFTTKKIKAGYEIRDLPEDTVKLVTICADETARSLSDLALHRRDLYFAKDCLEQINTSKNGVIRESLWRSSVTYFCKCFGNNRGRNNYKLIANKIYPEEGLEALRYFKALRDKHLMHDENSYSQSTTAAAINDGKKEYKIEKIISFSSEGQTLVQDNYDNLSMLIEEALNWVEKEYSRLCDVLKEQLEKRDYADLSSLKSLSYTLPKIEEIQQKRHKE